MTKTQDIAPVVVLIIFAGWIMFGNVFGYLWLTVIGLWLAIGIVEHSSHAWYKYQERRRNGVRTS